MTSSGNFLLFSFLLLFFFVHYLLLHLTTHDVTLLIFLPFQTPVSSKEPLSFCFVSAVPFACSLTFFLVPPVLLSCPARMQLPLPRPLPRSAASPSPLSPRNGHARPVCVATACAPARCSGGSAEYAAADEKGEKSEPLGSFYVAP